MDPIVQLPAAELRTRLARGALRAVEVAEAYLARVAAREATVQAWARLDPDHVRKQAAALDVHRASGRAIGPLHGLPVAIADTIDTAGIATENGTILDAGRMPPRDAFLVARLKQAGAIVMGKTETAELGHLRPGRTRNPHNPEHTPGGASSGSAAAVAAEMAPLAIGAQPGGSVIQTAAFCGVTGYTPSLGSVPRTGLLSPSPSLGMIGVFARTVEDAALAAEPLFGCDAGDPMTTPAPPPHLLDTARAEPPLRPVLAFVRQPCWAEADADTAEAFAELAEALGEACDEVDLPPAFAQAARLRETVHHAEMAKAYHRYESRGRARLSAQLQAALDEGGRIPARDYLAARDWPAILNAGLDAIFDRFDAIVTPSAPGAAPPGLHAMGSFAFNDLWTFCGTPAITVPLLTARNGLPMGVQLVGRRGDDARLLRTARWLVGTLSEPGSRRGEG